MAAARMAATVRYRQGFTLDPVRELVMQLRGMACLERATRVKWHRRHLRLWAGGLRPRFPMTR